MTVRRHVLGAATAIALTVPVVNAWAAQPPTDQLRGSIEQVVRLLEDPELKRPARAQDRRVAIRRIANGIFDFTEITKRALGHHWQARTPAEREEIVQLFTTLLERSYVSKIELYNGEKITYVGEIMDGDFATVRTRIAARQTEIPIDYRMLRRGDRWLAFDVMIEGVSLVANYRGQFNKILQTGSYAELVKRLRAKLEEPAEEAKLSRPSN